MQGKPQMLYPTFQLSSMHTGKPSLHKRQIYPVREAFFFSFFFSSGLCLEERITMVNFSFPIRTQVPPIIDLRAGWRTLIIPFFVSWQETKIPVSWFKFTHTSSPFRRRLWGASERGWISHKDSARAPSCWGKLGECLESVASNDGAGALWGVTLSTAAWSIPEI